jgi:NADH:ubiquinone oxidoreductase subunit
MGIALFFIFYFFYNRTGVKNLFACWYYGSNTEWNNIKRRVDCYNTWAIYRNSSEAS